jgi:DNA-binding PadR family transcriptional regulator
MNSLSNQEELVLLTVGTLYPEAYAYGLQQEIKLSTAKSFSLGTIHTILYRMENDGLLKSQMGGSSTKRGGRSKRIYILTTKGFSAVESLQRIRQAIWSKISPNHVLPIIAG